MNDPIGVDRKRGGLLTAALATGNFAVGMGAFVVIGVLSPIADDLEITAAQAGLVMTLYTITYAIISPLLISLTGKLKRRTVLMLSLGIFLAASLLCASATTAPMLYAARALAAVGGSMFAPVAASVAISATEPSRRGKALATVLIGFTMSQAIGTPLGSYVGYTFGWQAVFLIVAFLVAIALVLTFVLVPTDTAFQPNTLATLWEALKDWRSLFSVFVVASFTSAAYTVNTYIGPLTEHGMGFGRDGVSLSMLVIGLGAVVGSWTAGGLTDRIGPVRTLILVAVALATIFPFFSFLPLPLPGFIALIFLCSMMMRCYLVPQQTRLVRQTPNRQAVVLSLNATALYLGVSIGSSIGGIVIERFGFDWLGIAASVVMVVALLQLLLSERLMLGRRPNSPA